MKKDKIVTSTKSEVKPKLTEKKITLKVSPFLFFVLELALSSARILTNNDIREYKKRYIGKNKEIPTPKLVKAYSKVLEHYEMIKKAKSEWDNTCLGK